jgi:hypothetical protein
MKLLVRWLGTAIVGLYGGGCAYAASAQLVQFPGTGTMLHSPNRALSILNVDRDQTPNHSLLLRDEKTGSEREILDYGRHVDVMWAAHSQSFFVNDYTGSSESSCEIFSVADLKRIDVLEELQLADKAFPPDDHRYITCTAWRGYSVLISVSGRREDKPEGVERRYSIDTRTGKARALR